MIDTLLLFDIQMALNPKLIFFLLHGPLLSFVTGFNILEAAVTDHGMVRLDLAVGRLDRILCCK